MTLLNRTIPPPIELTDTINFPTPQLLPLANGSKLILINQGDVDVIRVDVLFNAGSRYQEQKLVAMGTLSLMPEGTAKYSSQQIAEHFDFLGSFINLGADKDFAKATAYSLDKYFPQTLEMLEEIIKSPSFPEQELKVWNSRGKQNLTVELDRTSTLARMEFFKCLFGIGHAYGSFALPNDYQNLDRNSLVEFHLNQIGSSDSTIILSGKVSEKHIGPVEKFFGNNQWGAPNPKTIKHIGDIPQYSGKHFINKTDAVQSAIRVGRVLFKRTHPDYTDMMVVNTILGGYFGSRLMKNIREEKGYTYGIGSYIINFRDSGVFVISTEVGTSYTKQTLIEIRKEIARLKTEPVSMEELSLVRSFLLGDVLRNFNGPFATADSVLDLLNFNALDYSFYDSVILSIKTITPERIMELSNKWLDSKNLLECVAGAEDPF